jgi:hypothetical protein
MIQTFYIKTSVHNAFFGVSRNDELDFAIWQRTNFVGPFKEHRVLFPKWVENSLILTALGVSQDNEAHKGLRTCKTTVWE